MFILESSSSCRSVNITEGLELLVSQFIERSVNVKLIYNVEKSFNKGNVDCVKFTSVNCI
jgi:hypothetical protein